MYLVEKNENGNPLLKHVNNSGAGKGKNYEEGATKIYLLFLSSFLRTCRYIHI